MSGSQVKKLKKLTELAIYRKKDLVITHDTEITFKNSEAF
jgi:hypothetical protein